MWEMKEKGRGPVWGIVDNSGEMVGLKDGEPGKPGIFEIQCLELKGCSS